MNKSINKRTAWNKGLSMPDEIKLKISKTLTGRKLSEEDKRKKSDASKKRWANPKEREKQSIRMKKSAIRGDAHRMKNPKIAKEHSKKMKGKMCGIENPMYGKTISAKHREAVRKSCIRINKDPKVIAKRSGELHWNWQGGKSFEPYCIEWTKDFKSFIFERDGYKCMTPLRDKSITEKNQLCAHHIDYNKKNCIPENILSLCNSCNSVANFNRRYWQKFYQRIINAN